MPRWTRACVTTCVVLMLLVGCSSNLQGKVITGPTPRVEVVDANDPRLSEPGLQGAVIEVTLDPGRLSAVHKPAATSNLNGEFAVPVGETMGGLQTYTIGVRARLSGYGATQAQLSSVPAGKRLLVILGDGRQPTDRYGSPNGQEETLQDMVDEGMRIQEAFD